MRVLSILALAGVALAAQDRAEESLSLHRGILPWTTIGSTDPHAGPLPDALWNFEDFSLSSPHGEGLDHAETDRIHASLLSTRDRVHDALSGVSPGDLADLLRRSTMDILVGGDPDNDMLGEMEDSVNELTVGEGEVHTTSGNGNDGDDEDDDTLLSARDASGEDGDPLTGYVDGESVGMREKAADMFDDLKRTADHASRRYLTQIAESDIGTHIAASAFVRLSAEATIPIPAFPPAFVRPAVAGDIVFSMNFRYLNLQSDFSIGLMFPPAKPVVEVFATLSGRARIVGHGSKARSISTPEMILAATQYAIYTESAKVESAMVKGLRGVRELLKSAGTPTKPSRVLSMYIDGFESEYVDLLSDEWTYVTEAGAAGTAAAANPAAVPDDKTILESIDWIEKMLEQTPTTAEDGGLEWKYTASAWWKFTSDLRYRLSPDGEWTWSPDAEHWMPISQLTVRGGRYNGRKPSEDNQKTIRAIELIFVTLGGRHMSTPGTADVHQGTKDAPVRGEDDEEAGNAVDTSYSGACFDLGGVCVDSAAAGASPCSGTLVPGACKGPDSVKCCVSATAAARTPPSGRGGDQQEDLLLQEAEASRGTDGCDCEENGSRIGAYDPDAWGSQCRDWDGSRFKWCYVVGRSAGSCLKYQMHYSRTHRRYWRKCGFGVWAEATARDAVVAAGDAADAVNEHVVQPAAEHISNAADTVNEHVVRPAAEGISDLVNGAQEALTSAQRELVAAARRTAARVGREWRELKQEVLSTVTETGAYRRFQRALFRGAKKPLRVFRGLASRMAEEGFSRADNTFERLLFVADAAVFRDFTRVLSIRESLFAFCKRNEGVEGVLKHMRTVLNTDDRFARATMETTDTGGATTRGHADGDDFSAGIGAKADPRYRFNRDATKDASGIRGTGEGIRKPAVAREMDQHEKDGGGGGNGARLQDSEALEMYALLAEEVVERYEHIRSMAEMVAKRLERLGDPTWASLSPEQKEEYRGYFFSIRRLTGSLKSLLAQVNRGDGPIKRALLGGTDWLERKVTSSIRTVRARMKAALGRNDWTIVTKLFFVVQFGASVRTPALPTLGEGEFKGNIGYSRGSSTRLATRHIDDPELTYRSGYSGPVVEVSGKFEKNGRRFVAWFKRETRHYASPHYCTKSFATSPCSEHFTIYFIMFPVNFGRFKASWVPLVSRIALIAAPKLANVLLNQVADKKMEKLERKSDEAVNKDAAKADAAALDEQTGEEGADAEEEESFLDKSWTQIHGLLHKLSPEVFNAPEDEGGLKVNITSNLVVNMLKDYGPAFLAQSLSGKVENQLGFISYMNEWESRRPGHEDRGIDSCFLQVFFKGTFATAMLDRVTRSLEQALAGVVRVRFYGEFGTLFWVVPPGAALRYQGFYDEAARGTALGPVFGGDSELATGGEVVQGERGCDQAVITSRLGMLRRAVEASEMADASGRLRSHTLRAIADMERFERDCATR